MIRLQDVKSKYAELRNDGFVKNLFVSFSGNALAQVIGFAFTPFITRVFSPTQYGIFALFFSISSNLSTVSTLQLPAGFVSARTNTELNDLIRISFAALFTFSAAILIGISLFRHDIATAWDMENLGFLIYLIPIQVFILGLDYILLGWNISLKQFSRGAIGRVVSIFAGKGVTLAYGILVAPTAYGLVLGNMLISIVDSGIKMSAAIRRELRTLLRDIDWTTLFGSLRHFRSYPLLVMPGIFLVGISQQLPLYIFSRFFDKGTVGYYALAASVIILPLQMVTTPVTSVFLQRAAELQNQDRNQLSVLVYQLHRKLFFISFLAMSILILLSDWIFLFIFGAEWQGAGTYASFIAVFTTLSVSAQPISVLFRLSHTEHRNIIINAITFGARAVMLMVGVYYNEPLIGLAGFTLVSVFSSATTLFVLFKSVDIKGSRIVPSVIIVLLMFVFVLIRNTEWFTR